jgi:hypothetical protein
MKYVINNRLAAVGGVPSYKSIQGNVRKIILKSPLAAAGSYTKSYAKVIKKLTRYKPAVLFLTGALVDELAAALADVPVLGPCATDRAFL